MKFIYLYIIFAVLHHSCNAQELEKLLEYNKDDIKERYIPLVMSLIDEYVKLTQYPFFQKENYHLVPLITIRFRNISNIKEDTFTYDKITIDSCIVYTLAFTDDKGYVQWIAGFDGGLSDIRRIVRYKNILKRITRQSPDAILYCRSFYDNNINGLLYIKNNNFYYYEKKPIEITDFFHSLSIQQLKFIEYVQVPTIYKLTIDHIGYRKTDDIIPDDENMIKKIDQSKKTFNMQ